jgi:membrane protein YdbS with pleckstrin-like domain
MDYEEINRNNYENTAENNSDTKPCPFCAEPIRPQAVKCRYCGEFLNTPKARAIQKNSNQPEDSENETEEKPEKILFATSPSIFGIAGTFIRSAVVFAIAITLVVYEFEKTGLIEFSQQQTLMFSKYRVIAGFALAIITILVLFIKVACLKSTYYEVTPRRIEYSRGILLRKVDNLDMFRIEDIKLRRNLFDYFFGIGTVTLLTSDKTDPNFTFRKVRRSKVLYKCIKSASLQADQREGVVHFE